MAFFDVDSFWSGGFSPWIAACNKAKEEGTDKFETLERAAHQGYLESKAFSALNAHRKVKPEPRVEPGPVDHFYWHRLGEEKNDPVRWEEARASHLAAIEAYKAWQASVEEWEREAERLQGIAHSSPEWQRFAAIREERAAFEKARKAHWEPIFRAEKAAGLHD